MNKVEILSVDHLCAEHTKLGENDIHKIKDVVKGLQYIADLNQANVFVDCPAVEKNHAIVVAEAVPATAKSLYKNQVVGKFAYESFEPAVFYVMRTGKPMFLNRALSQEGKTVEQSVIPIHGEDMRIIGALIMEKDISDKLKNLDEMEALSRANETLSSILLDLTEEGTLIPEVMEESFFILDEHAEIQYANPAAINLVNEMCLRPCLLKTSFYEYFPCLEELCTQPEELLLKEVSVKNKVFQVKRINLVHHQQNKVSFIIIRDLTELREKEREIRVKTVAIREIHHRVKNNLQTVASLLRLQMRRGLPEESKIHFIESLNRISSIASVYEIILSNAEVDDDVELFSLIEKIGNMLVFSNDHDSKNVTIKYEGPKLFVKSQMAVSLALVINELVQNCVKHAFNGRDSGMIAIAISKLENTIKVQVKDDGVGCANDHKPSLGLQIVKMMIEQDLAGSYKMTGSHEGTVVSILFPLERVI